MKIRYEVCRDVLKNGKPIYLRCGGRKKESIIDIIEIKNIDWDKDNHKLIRSKIYEKHPGCYISGYCPEE